MKKSVIVVGVLLAAGLVGVGILKRQDREVAVKLESGQMMAKNEVTPGLKEAMQAEGKYVVFSPEVLNSSAGNRRVLYFYANWCPSCRPADANLKENESKIPDDVRVIRVNYNDSDTDRAERDLAEKYGITYQHTFVQIDGQGKEITKWNGGQIEELLVNIK